MSICIKPAPVTGAFIENIDLNLISAAQMQQLTKALGEYGVLFFRNQTVTSDAHVRFAEYFGKININRFFKPLESHPQIAEVRKEPDQSKNIGEQWHTDHSYDQIPALGSILVARELPNTGGDTLFASMFAAYDGLSNNMKAQLNGLSAVHSSRHAFGAKRYESTDEKDLVGRLGNAEAAIQDAIHPVVIRHPISGKRAIYVNPDFTLHINDMPKADSDAILNTLYKHCQKPEYTYRFEWQVGSVAFWDNRATWHKALNDYPGQRRLMHRITVEGVALHA